MPSRYRACDIGLPDISGYAVAQAIRSDESLRLALPGRIDRLRARGRPPSGHSVPVSITTSPSRSAKKELVNILRNSPREAVDRSL